MKNLQELAFALNAHETNTGAKFAAEYQEGKDTLKVSCTNNPDAATFIVVSDEQILSVTHLFDLDEIDSDRELALYKTLLTLSPVIPLSSIGIQDGRCILFGAMSVDTIFDNIAYELECQAENTMEVLDALSDYFVNETLTEEIN